MLKMTRHLYTWSGNPKYLDYYERALYNHILASIDRSEDMNKLFTYFVPLRSGGFRTYTSAFNDWSCCHGTGMENHARYGDAIYFHATEDGKDVLYINLLIPSALDWKEKGIKVTIAPDQKISVTAEKPTEMTVKVRTPRNTNTSLAKKDFLNRDASHIIYKNRVWEGTMPLDDYQFILSSIAESMPDNKNRIAFFRGPILMVCDLGDVAKPIAGALEPVSEEKISLPFYIVASGSNNNSSISVKMLPKEYERVPFYDATRRYAVYVDGFTEEEWKERELAYKAEQERLLAMEKLTVDFFQPGEMQPERDHNFRGEKSAFGEAFDRKWRHASDGGSMTFEMKVAPDKKNKLVLTYWGGDGNNRIFDIIVEGKKIAEQRLENNAPDRFFDVEHVLNDESFRNKEKITVTLQARPGATAGGFFGCRTMIVE
jgi:hypothetical protein